MPKETIVFSIILFVLSITQISDQAETAIQTTQRTIMLDPGHGGSDKGMVSSLGFQEKDITLKLADKISKMLDAKYNVLQTRKKDILILPHERVFKANYFKADFYLSIHLHRQTSGTFIIYHFSPENIYPAPEQNDHLWKSQPIAHQSDSKKAAEILRDVLFKQKNDIHPFVQTGALIPLEGTTMPALLIEPLSISDPIPDEETMNLHMDTIALVVLEFIDQYFKRNPV